MLKDKKIFVFKLSAILLSLIFVFSPVSVNAQYNFGGRVTFMYPACMVPPGTWLIVVGPRPMSLFMIGGVPLIPIYRNGPPNHPGQATLGKAVGWMPCIIIVPCGFIPCPIIIGGGMLVLFAGTSAV